jgi:hypothetical protein
MALFSTQRAAPAANNHLIEFKAGKCRLLPVPVEEDNASLDKHQVRPEEGAGLVYLHQTDDMLTRFCYKDRTTNQVKDV